MRRFVGRTLYMVLIMWISTIGVFLATAVIRDADTSRFVPDVDFGLGLIDEYSEFLGGVFTGDWGHSDLSGFPVREMVGFHGRNTLVLGLAASLLVFGIGVPLGVLAAWRRNTKTDVAVSVGVTVAFGFPNFWLAVLLIWLFGPTLGMLPAAGCCSFGHLILPAVVLAAEGVALTTRFTRAAVLDVLDRDFIRNARAGGLPEWRVAMHAVRNSLISVLSIAGLRIGQIVAGAVVVETVFGWTGLGWILVTSVLQRDWAVVQFFSLTLVATVVIANWLSDIAYTLADPRLRRA